jgi:predicted nucleic acid-binding Zn ribbon protein
VSHFVCAYMGPRGECPECGGFNDTGNQFCSHECAGRFAERGEAIEAEVRARRAREDAFAVAADELRAQGHTDEEIDALLVGMPT